MPKEKKERRCEWFLEPRNSFSNEFLTKGLNTLSDEDLFFDALCDDGERRFLIRCLWSYVAQAQRSRKSNKDLSFRIWFSEGTGAIKFWKFDGVKKKVIKIPIHWKVIRTPE